MKRILRIVDDPYPVSFGVSLNTKAQADELGNISQADIAQEIILPLDFYQRKLAKYGIKYTRTPIVSESSESIYYKLFANFAISSLFQNITSNIVRVMVI